MLLLCVTLLQGVAAQVAGYTIDLYHYNGDDFVSLRWYPQTVDDYRRGAIGGFVVQRRIVADGRAGEWKELARVVAASYDDFFKLISDENTDSGLIGFALYQKQMTEMMKERLANDPAMADSVDLNSYDSPSAREYIYKMGLTACEFDWGASKMAAICYKDETADRTAVYDYRVVFADGKEADKSKVLRVNRRELTKLPAPTTFDSDVTDRKVRFSWDVSSLKEVYSGYRLERSEDGVHFERVGDKPIVHMYADDKYENLCMHSDELPKCDTTFYYRMCGICNFGYLGPYSKVLRVRCVSDYTVSVWIDTVEVNSRNEAMVKWHVDNPNNQKVKGFLVQRAEKMVYEPGQKEIRFSTLNKRPLSPKATSFKDDKSLPTNYYRVIAFGRDTSQLAVSNVQFAHQIDSVPPVPPVGLRGSVDSLGVVRLEWKENGESDLLGYRVFFANHIGHEFVACSDTFLKTPFYTDTLFLGSLTNEIFYKVMAVDLNYNQSALSEAVRLLKPDTIPPSKAVFNSVKQDSAGRMILRWTNSASLDLQKVELYRRISDEGEWSLLASFPIADRIEAFEDTFPFKGENVCYILKTYDTSNNVSQAESLPVRTRWVPRECLKNIKTEADYQRGGVRLVWERCGCSVSKILIYRSENGKIRLLDTIAGAERSFFDSSVTKGGKYKYLVRPITEKPSKVLASDEFVF